MSVTIGLIPRERFSVAALALERVLKHTELDYQLIVVDPSMPERYRARLETLTHGRPNVRYIHVDRNLLPNESRSLIAEASQTELTCFLENDSLVHEGWLTGLIAALEETNADVALSSVDEAAVEEDGHDQSHGMGNVGHFAFSDGPRGTTLKITRITRTMAPGDLSRPCLVDVAEGHCMLFRTEVLRRVQAFDDFLNTREFLDTCIRLHKAGVPVAYQPRSRVTFVPPPPVEREEKQFFRFKWDYDRAVASHWRIATNWDLREFPRSLLFVAARNHSLSASQLTRYRARGRLIHLLPAALRRRAPGLIEALEGRRTSQPRWPVSG